MRNHRLLQVISKKRFWFQIKRVILFLVLLLPPVSAIAGSSDEALFEMSLEQLKELTVRTVSRKEQEIFKAPSAVTVITSEDIRRSGATSIPQLLRLVPGMNVGRLNGNTWAINCRGENIRFSRYMLVMLDGRTVFSPLFNGVYWSRVDTLLEDIDRIEVIRGPGSSLWGSNAANGIINIVTKHSADTQGTFVGLSAGSNQFNNSLAERFGFEMENGSGRLYAKTTKLIGAPHPKPHEQSSHGDFTEGQTANDGFELRQGGFRFDQQFDEQRELTFQGDMYKGEEEVTKIGYVGGKTTNDTVDIEGANLVMRFNHQLTETSDYSLQLYYDYTRHENTTFQDKRQTWDFDFQHRFTLPRQEIVWGTGYRYIDDQTWHQGNMFAFMIQPPDRKDALVSLFMQDTINIPDNSIALILGAKYEHNDYTGSEWQPSAKATFTPDNRQTFWASIARAVSTPSLAETSGFLDISAFNDDCAMMGGNPDSDLGCVIPLGVENPAALVIVSSEMGYRVRLTDTLNLDNALYYNDYITNEDFEYIKGYEGSLLYQPWKRLRLELAYIFQDAKLNPWGLSNYSSPPVPRHSVKFKSYFSLTEQLELDMAYTYTDRIYVLNHFSTLDVRFGYRPNANMELSITGVNLLDLDHVEPIMDATRINTVREPAVIGKLTFRM